MPTWFQYSHTAKTLEQWLEFRGLGGALRAARVYGVGLREAIANRHRNLRRLAG
ncbi:hypothetical protein VB780_21790 [Leptolyngbya sp. CCNP1308]|uniref:hypothetical protein n=1 Tax=Leptolyngbya sp. CCNP1308 TaxID=3110255 RepID=UPI002B2025AF|nr:hypothetical protein [Leptolyngbya sp. CCNP1308]MEA5451228.1 hypothetical protein [Leptolyngbya sp. CCNP1308]